MISPLPLCRHRGQELSPGEFSCSSNRLMHRQPGIAPAAVCLTCRYADRENLDLSQFVPPVIPDHGPGTELKALLAELGLTAVNGCGCEDRARQMDLWGVDGCRQRRAEIVAWLDEARAKAGWATTLTATVRALSGRIEGLDLLDPLGWLVDEAGRRAEATRSHGR